jgi:DNA (cytosine-5)-methyltransferase 1
MTKPIKIIDLFAGPGGLGEGFSAYKENVSNPFKIAISIEKEISAHRTLTLRAFYRQFGDDTPEEYYQFLRGELGKNPEDQLYKIQRFAKQVSAAQKEARCFTLGEDNKKIDTAIAEAIGSDECMLIGGPPCQAYSLVGRARNLGIKGYKAEDDPRNFLYLEYLKVIAKYQPLVFVMENVKGLLSAKINGESIFDNMRKDLHNPCKATKTKVQKGRTRHNYRIVSLVCPSPENGVKAGHDKVTAAKNYIIKTEDFGIPQRRHRVILLGLREDIADKWDNSLILSPSATQTSTQEVLNDLPKLRSGLSKGINNDESWVETLKNSKAKLSKTLQDSGLESIAQHIETTIDKLDVPKQKQGNNFGVKKANNLSIKNNTALENWYKDTKLGNYVVNHETRGHIEKDLHRYMFCSTWALVAKKNKWDNPFPKSKDYPNLLKPNHENFSSGKFADRFRVQLSHTPATTVTSHISKDGHYYIHYDPSQCRSFTVREAARIQTFPDNYFFVGNRTQQYVQVGNAVPPFLAKQVASVVYELLLLKRSESKNPELSSERLVMQPLSNNELNSSQEVSGNNAQL